MPTDHIASNRQPTNHTEADSGRNLPVDKLGGHQRWRKIFKRAVSGGPQAKVSTSGLLTPSSGFSQVTSSGDDRSSANGVNRNNGNASSTDTQVGNPSLSTASQAGTTGNGSLSSVHLPLTPHQAPGSRDWPSEGPYSISTERSSGSSGIPLASPLPHTAKGRYFPFTTSSGGGSTETNSNSRAPEKKDKYRTLGRKANSSAKDGKASYTVSSTHSGVRNELSPVTKDTEADKSNSATQRFIRRVASAPNAKGLFSAGSMFNKGLVEPPLPSSSKMTGLGLPVPSSPTVRGDSAVPVLGLSNVDVVATQPGSDSPSSIMGSTISELAVSESHAVYPARQPIPRLLSGSSNLTPGASTASLVSTSTGAYSTVQSGPREHRAQSVGTAGRSALSPGMARLGATSGPAFRRTYSSNSIKSKTVSSESVLVERNDTRLIDRMITGRSGSWFLPEGPFTWKGRRR